MTKHAIITIGISASGKSTFAKEWILKGDIVQQMDATFTRNRVEVNRDNIRRSLMTKNGGTFSWDKWKWSREKEVTDIQNDQICAAYEAGHDILISDTNLVAKYRNQIISRLTAHGYEIELKEFPITIEEAIKRDNIRENGVGMSVIAKQYIQWLEYTNRIKYIADISKPKAILVDIDGTAAHSNGARGMFEWHNVNVDAPDEHVRLIVNALPSDVSVIFVSGRDEVCRELTQKWLDTHSFRNDGLFMREANNMEKDTVIKERIFWKYIASNYNVLFCIDDRPCVVRLYQELGIKVFAVGNQMIEF